MNEKYFVLEFNNKRLDSWLYNDKVILYKVKGKKIYNLFQGTWAEDIHFYNRIQRSSIYKQIFISKKEAMMRILDDYKIL